MFLNLAKTKNFLKLTAIFICLFLPLFVSAISMATGEDLTVKIDPELPGPRQTVNLKLESSLIDLNNSNITWIIGNKIQKQGEGATNFSFVSGDLGDTDTIIVETKSDFGAVSKKITISPAELNLIWEADSYTPPLYKGKALPSYQAEVKFVAVPNFINSSGKKIKPENLVYTWKRGWKILGSDSGYGKNVFIDKRTTFSNSAITVEVATSDGSLRARKSALVNNQEAKTIFYEKDSLLGIIYNKALTNQTDLLKEEITLLAIPFFFSNSDVISGNLVYNWSINNSNIQGAEKENTVTFKKNAEKKGFSSINLTIQNSNKIMQSAKTKLVLNLEGEDVETPFSLFNIGL